MLYKKVMLNKLKGIVLKYYFGKSKKKNTKKTKKKHVKVKYLPPKCSVVEENVKLC